MIGVLMLDTEFPRLPGDIGNPTSFDSPPLYKKVRGASVDKVVSKNKIEGELLDLFVDGGQTLINQGATTIGTSCGFLASAQSDIQQRLAKPFVSSSLLLVPLLRTMFGSATKIGVLTFDQSKLGPQHFGGHLDENISIHGLDPQGHWHQCIASNQSYMDPALAEKDAMDVSHRCINHEPETKLLLIECTNLSPWKPEIRKQFGIPVFDLVDALQWIDGAVSQNLE